MKKPNFNIDINDNQNKQNSQSVKKKYNNRTKNKSKKLSQKQHTSNPVTYSNSECSSPRTYPIKPIKFEIAPTITLQDLTKVGFRDRKDGYYTYKLKLFEDKISSTVLVDKQDMHVIASVTDCDGSLYTPFYDLNSQLYNDISTTVMKRYNSWALKMIRMGVLQETRETKEKTERSERLEKPIQKKRHIGKYHGEVVLQNRHNFQDNLDADDRPLQIKIKYFTDIDRLEKISVGDWIDLRAAEDVEMKANEFKLISLGVAMKLPDGYEAHVAPRSSAFKKFGVILTNSIGVIDNSYQGDSDIWYFPAYALRDTVIHKNDRICQFRITKTQPPIEFVEVDHLDAQDRGGIGSTGVQ